MKAMADSGRWGQAVLRGKQRSLELGEELERGHRALMLKMHTYRWVRRVTWWNGHMMELAMEGRVTLLAHQWDRLRRWYRRKNQSTAQLRYQRDRLGSALGAATDPREIRELSAALQEKSEELSKETSILVVIRTYINPEHENRARRPGGRAWPGDPGGPEDRSEGA